MVFLAMERKSTVIIAIHAMGAYGQKTRGGQGNLEIQLPRITMGRSEVSFSFLFVVKNLQLRLIHNYEFKIDVPYVENLLSKAKNHLFPRS